MNALIWKEIRLVLPAFIAAVLMIGAVMALQIIAGEGQTFGLLLFIGNLPVALLALTSFGREFSLGSFTFQMAQPVSRRILWRTKLTVLSIFLLALLVIGWGSVKALVPLYPGSETDFFTIPMLAALLLATATGALWSTLLLRQVIAAFWFALFLPWVLVMGAAIVELSETATTLALFAYAAAGFVFASRLFRKAEDANWTGGELDLPFGRGQTFGQRSKRPWRALFAKEIQSQQVTLIGIGALFLLHMIAVFLRKGAEPKGGMLATVLDLVPFVWVFVPLLAGGMSVAEERRMGTLEFYRTLPVGRGKQVLVKALTTLAIGGLLGSTLLIIAEKTAIAIGVAPNVGFIFSSDLIGVLVIVLLALSLIAFYASTVSRNVFQAFGISVVLSVLVLGLFRGGPIIGWALGWWEYPIFHAIIWPVLLFAMAWMTRANVTQSSVGWALWRRQVVVFIAALCAACVSAAAIYNRAWELGLPREPEHGAAGLSRGGPNPPSLSSSPWGAGVLVSITESSLRLDSFEFESPRVRSSSPPIKGDWADAGLTSRELLGIRSDGTLWLTREPIIWEASDMSWISSLSRFGAESNWNKILLTKTYVALLSRQDGSLWRLGPEKPRREDRQPLHTYAPVQLGGGPWERIVPSDYIVYVWDRRGECFMIYYTTSGADSEIGVGKPFYAVKFPLLDHVQFKAIDNAGPGFVGLMADGSLWSWSRDGSGERTRFDAGTDWVAISGGWRTLLGLKKDGSIWLWRVEPYIDQRNEAPVQLSRHHDWVAITCLNDNAVAMAADGSLWLWKLWKNDDPLNPHWLAPSRRPVRVSNVLEPR